MRNADLRKQSARLINPRSEIRIRISSQRPDGAARELAFEIDVALIARDQFTKHALDAAMRAPELNHPLRKRRAPEISIEASAHLCRASQFPTEIFAPAFFIIERLAFQIASAKSSAERSA